LANSAGSAFTVVFMGEKTKTAQECREWYRLFASFMLRLPRQLASVFFAHAL
jgi:hypothetical protein